MSSRLRYFQPFDDSTLKTCGRCGESLPLGEFIRDASKRVGRGYICRRCDRKKSRENFAEHREVVLEKAAARRPAQGPRFCSECGVELEGLRRVACGSAGCRDARFKRTNPEGYAARERAKVERRREARRKARES